MKKISKISLIAVGFGLALGLLTSTPVLAQGPSVIVKNTTANPVPTSAQGITTVAGSVAINGTPNVSVNNTVANPVPTTAQGITTVAGSVAISGTPNVNVTSPLTLASGASINVANSLNGGNPVPLIVRAANSPDSYPFIMVTIITLPAGGGATFPTTTSDGLTVKWDVIDQIDAFCNSNDTNVPFAALNIQAIPPVSLTTVFPTNVPVQAFSNLIPLSNVSGSFGSAFGSLYNYVVNTNTRIIVDPSFGSSGITALPFWPQTGTGSCTVISTGHSVV